MVLLPCGGVLSLLTASCRMSVCLCIRRRDMRLQVGPPIIGPSAGASDIVAWLHVAIHSRLTWPLCITGRGWFMVVEMQRRLDDEVGHTRLDAPRKCIGDYLVETSEVATTNRRSLLPEPDGSYGE